MKFHLSVSSERCNSIYPMIFDALYRRTNRQVLLNGHLRFQLYWGMHHSYFKPCRATFLSNNNRSSHAEQMRKIIGIIDKFSPHNPQSFSTSFTELVTPNYTLSHGSHVRNFQAPIAKDHTSSAGQLCLAEGMQMQLR